GRGRVHVAGELHAQLVLLRPDVGAGRRTHVVEDAVLLPGCARTRLAGAGVAADGARGVVGDVVAGAAAGIHRLGLRIAGSDGRAARAAAAGAAATVAAAASAAARRHAGLARLQRLEEHVHPAVGTAER